MKIYKMSDCNFRMEICCDQCIEIQHSHFDCPICGVIDAGTNAYAVVCFEEDDEPDKDRTFECEACKAKFKAIESPEDQWMEHLFVRMEE